MAQAFALLLQALGGVRQAAGQPVKLLTAFGERAAGFLAYLAIQLAEPVEQRFTVRAE